MEYADSQDPKGFRCYPRRPEDSKIDWSKDVQYIHRLIRASSKPYSGAYSYLDGKYKVTIWKAEIYKDNEKYCAIPGQISEISKDYFVVIAGNGKIKITDYESQTPIKSIRQRLL